MCSLLWEPLPPNVKRPRTFLRLSPVTLFLSETSIFPPRRVGDFSTPILKDVLWQSMWEQRALLRGEREEAGGARPGFPGRRGRRKKGPASSKEFPSVFLPPAKQELGGEAWTRGLEQYVRETGGFLSAGGGGGMGVAHGGEPALRCPWHACLLSQPVAKGAGLGDRPRTGTANKAGWISSP